MNDRVLKDAFVNLIDGYKIEKSKKLIKDIADTISQNTEILPEGYQFQSIKIEWGDYFTGELEKWDKFKKDKSYTEDKLKGRINKVIKQFLGDGNADLSVIASLISLKKEMGIQFIRSDSINFRKVIGWVKESYSNDDKYNYANWLDWASSNAKNVSFATHIAKLTHSGISGASNIYFDNEDEVGYLSTASLKNKEIEISQTNNALAPIGKLLQLQNNNESLSEQLKNGDLTVFKNFSENDKQLAKWKEGFDAVFKEKELATHYLAKQIYFPINNNEHCDDQNYHLINPMMSSSLDQTVFEKTNFVKYSKEMVEIRKQKREGKYYQDIQVSFPNLAVLKVTASNHGNASPLNGKRSGKRYLLPSMPPSWQKIQTPPLKQKSIFSGEFEKRAWKSTKELQKYLIKLQNKKMGNKVIRDQVKQHINNIINILFDYVLEMQTMPSNWSKKAKLKEAHALWLDLGREEQAFQEKRKSGQWQEDVCQDFGLWMNSKLSNKDMKLVQFEKNKWAKLLKHRLSLFDKGWGKSK